MLLLVLLFILLILLIGGGGYGYRRYGYVSWSPVAVLITIVLILWLVGAVRFPAG